MERQLALIEVEATEWRLDDTTRRVGLQGVAEARAALIAARRAVTWVTTAPSAGPAAA